MFAGLEINNNSNSVKSSSVGQTVRASRINSTNAAVARMPSRGSSEVVLKNGVSGEMI